MWLGRNATKGNEFIGLFFSPDLKNHGGRGGRQKRKVNLKKKLSGKKMGMNVLSLFDGISCGRVALERAGIKVDKYFASEIKKEAIQVTMANYPDTIQLGDVTKIQGKDLPQIDLLIGGSPCQDLSRAKRDRKGLEGEKSKLFYEYVRLLKETKPKYFLLENVASMDVEDACIITEIMGVSPVRIDSRLVSAQQRDRLYWTNIPGGGKNLFGNHIEQPEDKHIYLKDILESGFTDREKSRCLLEGDSRPLKNQNNMIHRYIETGFTTLVYKDEKVYLRVRENTNSRRGRRMENKVHTPTQVRNEHFIFENGDLRYLTQIELERLQTLPEGYTKILTRDKAAGCIGDGWTVDVISHIFKGLVKNLL